MVAPTEQLGVVEALDSLAEFMVIQLLVCSVLVDLKCCGDPKEVYLLLKRLQILVAVMDLVLWSVLLVFFRSQKSSSSFLFILV